MDQQDGRALGAFARKLGLITDEQLQDTLLDVGANPAAETILRGLETRGYLTPWQSSKLIKGDRDGYILGGYRLLYKIQSGSFGRVFRGDDPATNRVVAVKVLRRRHSENKQIIDLFIREGKVGLNLKHPNIVEILAIGHDKETSQHYLVMEFVEGGNLREIMGIRKKFNVADSLRILDDCISGLAYAYTQGITHRDMKLSNVLLSSTGVAKLVDFGLAQILSTSSGEEQDKVDRTVDYAGLEKATGVKQGDIRSDIFFLGCVFYELLTGRSPLPMPRDRRARMDPRRFRDIPPITREELEAPPSVFALSETMISLDPTRRFQTANQLLDSVKAVRLELERKLTGKASGPRTIFIAENNDKLQNALREKFKELGFRVLLASDPMRALDRFRQSPYDALLVDAGTTGEDGLLIFERVMQEAFRKQIPLGGVLILSEEQAEWEKRIRIGENSAILIRPVTLKMVYQKFDELLQTS